jgi:hypothetical protein
MKTFNYSSVTLNKLEEIFDIEKIHDRSVFDTWFSKEYNFAAEDNAFLERLINKNIDHINNYTELELISKFIAPILNQIDFEIKDKHIRDWYEVQLKYETENFGFNGRCDFVVAKGYDKPINPYFFIQEFKQTTSAFPEYQLLSEMIVATKLNNTNHIKGAFIIGSIWVFMILNQLDYNKYQYCLSRKYDGIELDDLKQIYQLLQQVKSELMEVGN